MDEDSTKKCLRDGESLCDAGLWRLEKHGGQAPLGAGGQLVVRALRCVRCGYVELGDRDEGCEVSAAEASAQVALFRRDMRAWTRRIKDAFGAIWAAIAACSVFLVVAVHRNRGAAPPWPAQAPTVIAISARPGN